MSFPQIYSQLGQSGYSGTVSGYSGYSGNPLYPSTVYTPSYSSVTVDWSLGNVQGITLYSNLSSIYFINSISGQTLNLYITNTGPYTVNWKTLSASIIWPNAVVPVTSPGTSGLPVVDQFTFTNVFSSYYATVNKNLPQYSSVPNFGFITSIAAWGAGGGGDYSGTQPGFGGGGGYAGGNMVLPWNTTFTVIVGSGGSSNNSSTTNTYGGYGGGGYTGPNGYGGQGGGYTGMFLNSVSQAGAVLIAGGGGGASWEGPHGGAGGGFWGMSGSNADSTAANQFLWNGNGQPGGGGGTQLSGGNIYINGVNGSLTYSYTYGDGTTRYMNGTPLQGGSAIDADTAGSTGTGNGGGGGGGGYWGGSAGTNSSSPNGSGGGGGSAYLNPNYIYNGQTLAGWGIFPGNASNPFLSPTFQWDRYNGTTVVNGNSYNNYNYINGTNSLNNVVGYYGNATTGGTSYGTGGPIGNNPGKGGLFVLYYPGSTIYATGGTITQDGNYTYHTFNTPGQYTLSTIAGGGAASTTIITASALLVAGGGAGGEAYGGGGGAGGVVYTTTQLTQGVTYNVFAGTGGGVPHTDGYSAFGLPGINTTFYNLVAWGGGGGGSFGNYGTPYPSLTGGAGGGAGGYYTGSITNYGGTGVAGQGYTGGNSNPNGYYGGGGGGGAGGAGQSATGTNVTTFNAAGGQGGIGVTNGIVNALSAGQLSAGNYYIAGGGGGANAAGGLGGGGQGGVYGGVLYSSAYIAASSVSTPPVSAVVQLWGAGGGAGSSGGWSYGAPGGAGGYTSGTIVLPISSSVTILVGQSGWYTQNSTSFGGGGRACWNNSDNRYGAGGGGYTGLFLGNGATFAGALAIAGGGGGGGSSRAGYGNYGGNGGGSSGYNGAAPYNGSGVGYGGTQTAAGANASSQSVNTNQPGGQLLGGSPTCNSYGGGGGGGYYGGGGGGYWESNTMGGGGGGAGYLNPVYTVTGYTSASPVVASSTTGGQPIGGPPAGVAVGGTANGGAGGNGYASIYYLNGPSAGSTQAFAYTGSAPNFAWGVVPGAVLPGQTYGAGGGGGANFGTVQSNPGGGGAGANGIAVIAAPISAANVIGSPNTLVTSIYGNTTYVYAFTATGTITF
jgi:Glycine rich protein